MATLEIGSWSSRCSACGKGASMSEDGHDTILGYQKLEDYTGCGEKWDRVILTYTYGGNEAMQESIDRMKKQYPALADLPWDFFHWNENN